MHGVRTPADSEVIIADCTAESTNDYTETSKKWIGQITYTLSSSGGGTFDYTFNYGLCKYEDFSNTKVTITSFEIVGEGNTADATFNVTLMKHTTTGWTYSAAAFDSRKW